MYPGVNNTELCPTRFFTGEPLYRDGHAPDDAEIARRRDTLLAALPRRAAPPSSRACKAAHGHAVLFDGHSIKRELPWLFEGRLPDLNLGTAERRELRARRCASALAAVLAAQTTFTHVVDGRFKGGYITRHYGRPARGRARGAAGDVLAPLHGRERRPSRCDASARGAAAAAAARACVQTHARLAAR